VFIRNEGEGMSKLAKMQTGMSQPPLVVVAAW